VKNLIVPAQDRFGITVGSVHRAWHAKLNSRLRPLGGSSAKFLAMLRISESKNGLVQRDLASVLTIEESTLTRLLDRMEADGLVRRMPSSQDRRETCVTLTPAARPVLKKLRAAALKLHSEALEPFNDAELRSATELLAKVTARLEQLP
jgi:MarR family transcriptional regulator for hemolysin